MNKIIKRIVSAVTAVAVTLTVVFVFDVPEMIAAEAATTSNCNGAHTGMTEWTDNKTIPTASGKYYLTTDVTFGDRQSIPAGVDITLCLNGHKVTQNKKIIQISGNFTLCDCKGSGIITGCNGQQYSIRIESSGTFTMNGGKISGHTNIADGTVMVCGGTFVMNGGEISNNSGAKGGVYNFIDKGTYSKFTMNGGKITGNTVAAAAGGGGGVLNYRDCTFIMNGGEISGNTVNGTMVKGGGVHNSGSFTMNGGKITGNNAPNGNGGGVYNLGDATFIMDGGEISGNKAKNGGGVDASSSSCTFTMSGGKITGNSATSEGGGLYVSEQNVTLDGKIEISGNKVGETKNNVYISTGNTITIGNGFATNSQIGVTTETAVSNCTTGVYITGAVNSNISSCFTPDVDGLSVEYKDNKLRLIGPHSYNDTWSHDTASHWQTCTRCGGAGPKSEHTWNDGTVTTAATCTTKGVRTRTCSVCNATKTEDIPATGHNTSGTIAHKDATCTTAGVVGGTYCTVCNNGKADAEKTIPATGHNSNGTVAHKDATCTATGVEGGTYCTVCNNGKADAEKTIPMLPHTEVDDPAVAPTCTATGKTAGKHCSVCGAVTKAQETVSMLPHDWDEYQHDQDEHWQPCKNCDAENNREGHNWDGGTTVTEATEYAEGEMLYTCTVCTLTKTEPITKLPHTHKWSDEWTHNDYYHWHECTEADLHESEVHGEEFAHDWELSEVLKEATCTETGMGKYVCPVCGAEKTEELAIDADAHDWESWTILLSPTLKTEGTAQRVCTRNSDHTDTVDLPVLTDKTVWTKVSGSREDPTLKDKGSEDYTSEYGTVTLPIPELTDPVWGTPTRTDPTKEAEGKDEYTSTDYGTVTVTIPKLTDPVWGTPTRTDPTKEAEGKDEYHSDIYGDVTVVIPELSNTNVWTTDDSQHVEPTEEETGKDVYISTDYGEVEVVLPKKEHTHTWGAWSIIANPTLTETGTAQRVCTKNSAHTDTKTLPVLTDTSVWTKDDTQHVDPTEDNDGKDVYTSEYGEVTDILPALGHTHTWGAWSITVNPTLTETGAAQRVCTLNNTHIDTKTLPVLTDTSVWTKDDTQHVDPTEDNDGKDVYTSEYGEVTDILPALGHTHSWGAWSITVNPTLTETGTAQRVCTKNSAHTDTKTLPVLTDTSVWTKDDTQHIDPTEDNDGKDVYTSEYGEVIYPLDKLPHTHKFPLTFVPEVKPTEDKEGVKEHWHCDGCGKDFEDEDGTKEVTADDLKIGKIETVVQAPVNFPKPVIATPEEELAEATLTEEEQKKVDEGAVIKIILKVEDATNTVQSEDKTAVTDKLGELTNYKLGQYLDVTLLKKIGEQQEQKIANTSKPISITFEIPESLRGKSEYSVIRVHGDEATILRDLDSDPNTVTIETDKFSTYALTYKEKTSGGGSGGDGSSHRHRYIYDEKMIKEPTCTESGEKTLSCSCGQTTTETVPALGHDYHSEITKPATETENGIRTFTCTRCGDSYTELIEKTSDETSDNTPSDTSESTSGDTSDNMPSDTSDNTSSNIADSSASDNSSSGESSHIPSESDASSGDNPATGIAVSLIPLTVAVAVVIAAAKRRHK